MAAYTNSLRMLAAFKSRVRRDISHRLLADTDAGHLTALAVIPVMLCNDLGQIAAPSFFLD
jgi:hypothetical protein